MYVNFTSELKSFQQRSVLDDTDPYNKLDHENTLSPSLSMTFCLSLLFLSHSSLHLEQIQLKSETDKKDQFDLLSITYMLCVVLMHSEFLL